MIRINQIKINICKDEDKIRNIRLKLDKILRTKDYEIIRICKESIDARDKSDLKYIFGVDVKIANEEKVIKKLGNNNNIMLTNEHKYIFPVKNDRILKNRPVIVGAGPAGYFCGLNLARAGFKPIIIERGKNVNERGMDVEKFWRLGVINSESNVSFGEGGAGTFSDGKLSTGIKDKNFRIDSVLEDFIKFGADEDIAYKSKPHIGTDVLKTVLSNMRHEIENLGGMVLFSSKLVEIITNQSINAELDNSISEIVIDITNNIDIDKKMSEIENVHETYFEGKRCFLKLKTDAVVLAIGHSARDTFAMLYNNNIPMEAKAFAMGLRIEHKREMIDRMQYGTSKEAQMLPASSYKMTYRSSEGRSVYSFCMCPGGFVVNASSDINQSVVNGMSNHARDEENSNSAIVVNVTPEDFCNEGFGEYGALAGMHFQQKYEKKAYEEGKSFIPVQKFGDYKDGKISTGFGEIRPNIKGSYTFADLNNCLPAYVNNAIIEGVNYYETKLKGFADSDAVLSGIESRTSSPVRIIRDNSFMSETKGLFPCGEGAGYAGGITSAAVDGIKVAEAVAEYITNLN